MFQRFSLRAVTGLVLKMAITVVALFLAFRQVDFGALSKIAEFNIWYFVLGIGGWIVILFIQSTRWQLILESFSIRIGFTTSLRAIWFGHLLNNVLPTSVAGDLVRGLSIRSQGASNRVWLSALISEKYAAIVTAVALSCIFGVFVTSKIADLQIILYFLFSALVLGAGFGWLFYYFFHRHKIFMVIYIAEIAKYFFDVFLSRRGIFILICSVLINAVMALVLYASSATVGGNIPLMTCLFVGPIISVVASLPISYGGWGLRELSGMHLLTAMGFSSELSLAALLVFGIFNLLSSLPGALVAPALKQRNRGIPGTDFSSNDDTQR